MYYFFIQSLILSVIFHLLVFKVFIFIIPVKAQPEKPEFIFLGSILKNQETSSIAKSQDVSDANKLPKYFSDKKFESLSREELLSLKGIGPETEAFALFAVSTIFLADSSSKP